MSAMLQIYLAIPMPEAFKILKSHKIFILPTIAVDTFLIFKAVTWAIALTN